MPINVLLILLTGWLAFFNPDPEQCWTSMDAPGYVYNADPSDDSYTNFGSLFRLWFTIGFGMIAVWTAFSIFFMVGVFCKCAWPLCVSCIGLVMHIVNIAWVVFGFVMFSSEAAKTAMGDAAVVVTPAFASADPEYMMTSAGVAWLLILIEIVMMLALYCCAPIVCCIASCCGSKDD